jgi:hypothetical protein
MLVFNIVGREGADVEPAEEGGPLQDPEVEGAPDAAGDGQQRTRCQAEAAGSGQGRFNLNRFVTTNLNGPS